MRNIILNNFPIYLHYLWSFLNSNFIIFLGALIVGGIQAQIFKKQKVMHRQIFEIDILYRNLQTIKESQESMLNKVADPTEQDRRMQIISGEAFSTLVHAETETIEQINHALETL